jgi:hypothetical protein
MKTTNLLQQLQSQFINTDKGDNILKMSEDIKRYLQRLEKTIDGEHSNDANCCENCRQKYMNTINSLDKIQSTDKLLVDMIMEVRRRCMEFKSVCKLHQEIYDLIEKYKKNYRSITNLTGQIKKIFINATVYKNTSFSISDIDIINLLTVIYAYLDDSDELQYIATSFKYLDINIFNGLPLMILVCKTNLIQIKKAVELGADLNIRDEFAIYYSIRFNKLAITLYLLNEGLTIDTAFNEIIGKDKTEELIYKSVGLFGDVENLDEIIVKDLWKLYKNEPAITRDILLNYYDSIIERMKEQGIDTSCCEKCRKRENFNSLYNKQYSKTYGYGNSNDEMQKIKYIESEEEYNRRILNMNNFILTIDVD